MKKNSLPKPVTIKHIVKENGVVKTFITNENIVAQPGQFIMVWLPGVAEKPFSIVNDNPLTFTVKSVGNFTNTINKVIKKGDKIWYRGPFGNGVFKNVNGKKILICGGCGCVPIYFFAKSVKNRNSIIVINGAKTKKELLFVDKFKKLKARVLVSTDDGSDGDDGSVIDLLKKFLHDNGGIGCVYGCGKKIMLKKMVRICDKYNIRYQVSLEALIKCGIGVCGSCSFGGKLICKDGPVFSKWPGESL